MKVIVLFAMLSVLNAEALEGTLFKLGGQQQKCFFEDLSSLVLLITFRMFEWPENVERAQESNFEIHVSIRPNITQKIEAQDHKQIRGRNFRLTTKEKATFTFQARQYGVHKICFSSPKAEPNKMMLQIDIKQTAIDSVDRNTALATQVSALHTNARRLNDRIYSILAEHTYRTNRDIALSKTAKYTGNGIVWWSIINSILLIMLSLWQIRYLKRLFGANL
eukprot:TRINITY_DN16178_c0_g1_i1.p1 TRINITY_DN16178_c0_g1~~TRINITY_DN16178_c0_g1_i1.p1  ORF type:complete len:221 (-),score=20.70 TRINITY_DN16178_c0_g1_i1:7-669(-)